MSGVWVWDWMARNWVRRAVISAGVKPAASRRSKPRGGGVVVDVDASCVSVVVVGGWVLDKSAASASCAALASEARSEGVRVSPMEQCM